MGRGREGGTDGDLGGGKRRARRCTAAGVLPGGDGGRPSKRLPRRFTSPPGFWTENGSEVKQYHTSERLTLRVNQSLYLYRWVPGNIYRWVPGNATVQPVCQKVSACDIHSPSCPPAGYPLPPDTYISALQYHTAAAEGERFL